MIQDRQFFRRLLTLSTPIIIQNLLTFALGAVDMLMIGQLGDKPVAAVGLADQVFFVMILMQFGIASGAAIFVAQYWGKGDIVRIHRVLGLALGLGVLGSLSFTLIAVFTPQWVLGIYTKDTAVIALGSDYLRIVGWSYIGTSVAIIYNFVLRSIEQVKLPMITGAIALLLNTGLNYILIFGHFGFPALGVSGAAIATCGARLLEPVILLGIIYSRKLPLAAPPRRFVAVDRAFVVKFLNTTLPVVATEVVWSLGITMYSIIYAHISTEAIAAINIVVTIERVAFVIFLALSNASAIMIGNLIGANEIGQATRYARRFLILGVLGALPVGLLVALGAEPLLSLYQISPTVSRYARLTMTMMALVLPLKVTTLMIFIGVLRSGGDTQFSLLVEACFIWLLGVPLAYFGAFVLGLPVYWVYLLVVTEEVGKALVALRRFISGKWIHRLAEPEVVGMG